MYEWMRHFPSICSFWSETSENEAEGISASLRAGLGINNFKTDDATAHRQRRLRIYLNFSYA